MTLVEKCPKCGSDLIALVDPEAEEWGLDPHDFDEFAEVWFCHDCEWNEQADEDDAFEYHEKQIEWALSVIARNQK